MGNPKRYSNSGCVCGGIEKREQWLELMERNFRTCAWVAEISSDWDEADLNIKGPGPAYADFISTHEMGNQPGEQYLRFRIDAHFKPWAWAVMGLLLVFGTYCLTSLYTMPLLVPIGLLLRSMVWSRRHMIRAVSHLAIECGEAIGMKEAR